MKNQYIVRTPDNRLFAVYHSDISGIVARSFDNGRWSKPTPIAPDMQEGLTLSADERGTLYMFCRHNNGGLHLYRYQHSTWNSRIMLENHDGNIPKLHPYPIVSDNRMAIIYSCFDSDNDSLMLRRIDEHGSLHAPITIDNYIPLGNVFSVQAITPTHHLIFYAKKNADKTAGNPNSHAIGYVETDLERVTTFNTVYSTNQRIADTSFLVTDSSIHALFIVRGMFGSQVVYRKKSDANFCAPAILAQAPQISNCLLIFVSGKLRAYFTVGGQLVSATSDDSGDTFRPVSRCTNKFCVSPVKSIYISQIPMSENTYFVRQLFVDRNNAADIQLLPDIYEDFLPLPSASENDTTQNPTITQPHISDELTLLKDKLDIAQMQLQEKERQIVRHMYAHNTEKAQLLERIKQLEGTIKPEPNQTTNTRKYPLMIV